MNKYDEILFLFYTADDRYEKFSLSIYMKIRYKYILYIV